MGSYTCTCDSLPGTRLAEDRHSCEDVDECGLNNGGCSHTCLNTLGRAFCVCPEGWMLDDDWKTCIDIDECSLEYQKSLKLEKRCDYGCINTLGSYRCIIEIGGADEAVIDDVPACPNGFYFNVTVDDCQGESPIEIVAFLKLFVVVVFHCPPSSHIHN
jgi:Coagulation Factor Xa inhibitory site